MTRLRTLLSRLVTIFRRSRIETDIDEEIRSHLEMQADDHRRNGMNLDQARQSALRDFGGVDQVKERYRDHTRLEWLEGFFMDLRFALRTLRKNPSFTAVAVLTLALGVGINTAVFTVTNAALFKGFPLVKNNDRLLYIKNTTIPYPDFADWQARATSFSEMAAAQGLFRFASGSGEAPEIYTGSPVTFNTFHMLGVSPMIGRDFTASDAEPGASPVAILSYDLWERRFAKDPALLGRSISLNGTQTTVVGIMPAGLSFPQKQDLWLPIVTTADVLRRDKSFAAFAVGRMADGATVERTRAEMENIGHQLQNEYPRTTQGIPVVKNFNETFIGAGATELYKAMWGAVAFVLLIACANVANLLLGRAIGRSREISLRIALGAGRWRIIRQLLIESVLLSSLGGVLGWWIAQLGLRAYVLTQRSNSWFAYVLSYSMDYRVFIYFVSISIGTGFFFGLVPTLRLSRPDVNNSLKDGGHGGTGGQNGKRLSAILIAGEVALAVVLLAGAGVMIRSFLNIYSANIGIRTDNILAAYVYLPLDRYPTDDAQMSFVDRLKSSLETIPGVESVAVGPAPTEVSGGGVPYEIGDAPPVDERNRPLTIAAAASPNYFRTLGATLLYGREVNDFDRASSLPVVIVNERFASLNWPGESPLGRHLRLIRNGQPGAWLTVVGVTSNVVQNDPTRQQFDPMVYVPLRQSPRGSLSILARTHVPPESLSAAFQHQLQTVDPALPFQHLVPLTALMSGGGVYELNRNIAILFLVFGATALLLASVGLYAVIAHSVNQRTQEIGIRMAIGATAHDIRKLVLTQGMIPLGVGLTLGMGISVAVNPVLKSELVKVSPADPTTLVVAASALILSAMLGCWIPARRAMQVDPVIALRNE